MHLTASEQSNHATQKKQSVTKQNDENVPPNTMKPNPSKRGFDSPTARSPVATPQPLGSPLPIFGKRSNLLYNLPAKNGTGLPSISHPPTHIVWKCPQKEALYMPNRSGLVARIRSYDQYRQQNSDQTHNKVIYDALTTPLELPTGSPSSDAVEGVGAALVFESRFESGNLRRAVQVFDYEYDLVVQPDINTNRHTQWFYFRVSNTIANQRYRFNIVNMLKKDSLANKGMRPLMYSERDAKTHGIGWRRCGFDVCYYQNEMKRSVKGYYFTYTFSVTFRHTADTVYFAYCYPYTYTDFQQDLSEIERDPRRTRTIRRRNLCHTLANNGADLLTITEFNCPAVEIAKRKVIILSARVHPGESNSSYMMKGIVDMLTSDDHHARELRKSFVFKLVPMLNPDGVINGNYRCSLAGVDLNRQWKSPNRHLHPTIYHLKNLIVQNHEERRLFFYCDLHGHSRKHNIFMYGCSTNAVSSEEKLFPWLLNKRCCKFSFQDSFFGIDKNKESTARVVVWKECGLANSYTLEASFAGATAGEYCGYHFDTTALQQMGVEFLRALHDFSKMDTDEFNSLRADIGLFTSCVKPSSFLDSDEEASEELTSKGKKSRRKRSSKTNVESRRAHSAKDKSNMTSSKSSRGRQVVRPRFRKSQLSESANQEKRRKRTQKPSRNQKPTPPRRLPPIFGV